MGPPILEIICWSAKYRSTSTLTSPASVLVVFVYVQAAILNVSDFFGKIHLQYTSFARRGTDPESEENTEIGNCKVKALLTAKPDLYGAFVEA
jgi:hypothetical protein